MSTQDRLIHMRADSLDRTWLGRRLIVTTQDGLTHEGGLSDVEQHPTVHRTVLFLGGETLDVHASATVTSDPLGLIGGAS